MKKLIIVITVLVLIAGVAGYIVFSTKNSARISQGQLSERARQHIESQKTAEDDPLWRNVNFEQKRLSDDELNEQYLTFDGCYRLNVPFEVNKEEERGECTYAISISPAGWLVVSYAPTDTTDMGSVSGVALRRNKADEYSEKSGSFSGVSYVIFKKTLSGYESSAFSLHNGRLLTLSLTSPSNEDLEAKFEQILESLELY